uniref:Focal AT domain-containing protein n=1 Tax=Hucho hucho TaxID=62062 RepID=A0A4W5MAU8_9TELE
MSPRRCSVGEPCGVDDARSVWERERVEDTLRRQREDMLTDSRWLEQEEKQLHEEEPADQATPPPDRPPKASAPQPTATAELDRTDDQVYVGVMAMVRDVVQLKNDVNTLPPSEYPNAVKTVGLTLRSLIRSVDEVLPSLHSSARTEVPYGSLSLNNRSLSMPQGRGQFHSNSSQFRMYTEIPILSNAFQLGTFGIEIWFVSELTGIENMSSCSLSLGELHFLVYSEGRDF